MADNSTRIRQYVPSSLSFVSLTKPALPAPLRSTVWVYLFALPFQLVDDFGWHTIPGVCVAAFIYLGFVATGEEIEQPFGACHPLYLSALQTQHHCFLCE